MKSDKVMRRDIEEIKRLVGRYDEGETTVEEERELADFFCRASDTAAELEAEKQMFSRLQTMAEEIEASADFEQRLCDALDAEVKKNRKSFMPKPIKWAVAASVALVACVGTFLYFDLQRNPHEITDSRLACAKTEEALLTISEKLNKVDSEVNKINITLNKLMKDEK